ncbi:MAG: shikimate dehydrogenase [Pseudomonadota bacterium]
MHGFWLDQLGIAADYRATLVDRETLESYLAERREDKQWRGCNVTMPHKQSIISALDRLDPVAERIGAVNTVVRESAELVGYNTDAVGFLEPLKAELANKHLFRMARIIGTGGASRAIITALAAQGFTLVVAGRNPEKARALLDELALDGEHHTVHLSHFAQGTDFAFDDREGCFDLVINASPLGMRNQPELAFDWSHAPPGSIAYDIVTDPAHTPFLERAAQAGFQTVDGLSMLIGQAANAFFHFFHSEPPREHDDELRKILSR